MHTLGPDFADGMVLAFEDSNMFGASAKKFFTSKKILDSDFGDVDVQTKFWLEFRESMIENNRPYVYADLHGAADDVATSLRQKGLKWRQLNNGAYERAHTVYVRIVEQRALVVNEVIVSNMRAFQDIIARQRRLHVERRVECRCQWARREYEWRQLRHQRGVLEFHALIETRRFTNPPARVAFFDTFRGGQRTRHAEREVRSCSVWFVVV